LVKVKQENTKLKEELNEYKKNYEHLDKFFKSLKANNSGHKLNSLEFSQLIASKEQELMSIKKIMHQCLTRIKSIFERLNEDYYVNITDDTMKSLAEGKTLEEKFEYYLEKLIKYQEVFYLLTFSLRKRLKII
jgi:hypothetical protein